MQYRDDIWEGEIEDSEDHYENIYRCGFLLYKMKSPEDIFLFWEAKWLNMDLGSMIDIPYFLGAGYQETMQYLNHSTHKDAKLIQEHISNFSEKEFMTIETWEKNILWEFFDIRDSKNLVKDSNNTEGKYKKYFRDLAKKFILISKYIK